jgi:FKBP-type peptidyl-prolyl cis-trans isomerase
MNRSLISALVAFCAVGAGIYVFQNRSKGTSPESSATTSSPVAGEETAPNTNPAGSAPADSAATAPAVQDTGELQVFDIKLGDGAIAEKGKTVSVHYTGTLLDGTKFDSSHDRNQPFDFGLGGGQVIQGWDLGVAGMKVGGVRKLVIPAKLGYGEQGAGGVIPPNAALVFEVQLLDVK